MPVELQGAPKPKDQRSRCTCGHHYGRVVVLEKEKNDNDDAAPQSSTFATSTTTTTTSSHNRPLDASFVQVPQHDYRNDLTLQQLHQEEQQKHGAVTTSSLTRGGDVGKVEYYQRLIRLEQAAKAGYDDSEDATPPPPLCLSCIQR